MIWLPLQRKLQTNLIVSANHPCERVRVLYLSLLLNLSTMMPMLLAICMKTAVGKRSFALILKKGHKEAQCRTKFRDANQRKEARPNTAGAQIATVNESGSNHCQSKEKYPACRQ